MTPIERIILLNQFRILNSISNTGEFDRQVEILEEGYEREYDEVLCQYNPLSKEDCKFVVDVLQMYRCIYDYKKHHPSDKDVADHPYSTYRGFQRAELSKYAAFLRKREEFPESLNEWDGKNPHWNMEIHYEPMVEAFLQCPLQALPDQIPATGLNQQQVKSILAAADSRVR